MEGTNGDKTAEYSGRCENVSTLVAHLQRLLEHETERFVLVFDGIDKQRESPPTLLPALARLSEFVCSPYTCTDFSRAIRLTYKQVPNLQVLLIVRHPSPRFLHRTGVPSVHFQPYTRNQSIHILSRDPPDIFLEPPPAVLEYDDEVHEEDKAWLWPRFCAAVWDSLAANAARDLLAFQELCHKLWRPFVTPVVRGDFGTRDFSRLLVAQRRLFQDESVLLNSILPNPATSTQFKAHDLPYYAKWLLVAAYLASHNPAKQDALFFMKSTERKRRKKGGGTARPRGRPSQTRKVARHLLAPSTFTLDRLLSILHAILPHDFRSSIDIYTQVATLSSLRLLVRSGGIGSSDPLEPAGKWRVGPAVTWEYAQAVARGLKFDLIDYVAE